MTDQQRLMEMLDKIRATFPQWGFTVGVVELDTNKIWGWTNMKNAGWVYDHLSNQEKSGNYDVVQRIDRQ